MSSLQDTAAKTKTVIPDKRIDKRTETEERYPRPMARLLELVPLLKGEKPTELEARLGTFRDERFVPGVSRDKYEALLKMLGSYTWREPGTALTTF